jgi:hypothetical protein
MNLMKKLALGAAFVSAAHAGTTSNVSVTTAMFTSGTAFEHNAGTNQIGTLGQANQASKIIVTNVPLAYSSAKDDNISLTLTPTTPNAQIGFMYAITDHDPITRQIENFGKANSDTSYGSVPVIDFSQISGWKYFTVKSGVTYDFAPSDLKLSDVSPCKNLVVRSMDGSNVTVLHVYLVKTS